MTGCQLQRVPGEFVVERLPDGSTVVFESATKTVHSLNPLAALVFEACREKISVTRLIEAIGSPVSEEPILAAIGELESAGLVERSGAEGTSRRGVLRAVGIAAGAAVPMVLSLTASEQRAYAAIARSGPQPTITAVESTICDGQDTLDIFGVNTHFAQGSSIVTFDQAGVTAGTVTVTDPTHLSVQVLSSIFFAGSVGVTVTTGSEIVVGPSLVQIQLC